MCVCVCDCCYESVVLIHDTVGLFGQKFSVLTRFSFRAVFNSVFVFSLCESMALIASLCSISRDGTEDFLSLMRPYPE